MKKNRDCTRLTGKTMALSQCQVTIIGQRQIMKKDKYITLYFQNVTKLTLIPDFYRSTNPGGGQNGRTFVFFPYFPSDFPNILGDIFVMQISSNCYTNFPPFGTNI